MKFGFVLPYGNARFAADVAREAEAAGWDGFFVGEWPYGIDAWVSLAAAAMVTDRIRLGTMVTPLSRMRPWKVASEAVTLDHLSRGRVILGVGLGATNTGFDDFGEETDPRVRAELLDESLEIITSLWRGEAFVHEGRHNRVRMPRFQPPPPPVQQPRIPIWVVAAFPRERSMARALRYDGLIPNVLDEQGKQRLYTPEDIARVAAYARERRPAGDTFDIVVDGWTPGDDPAAAAAEVRKWRDAEATWWTETTWELPQDQVTPEWIVERVAQGPPRLGP